MTVTIVGDLDRDQALAVAERTFGVIPARPVHHWEEEAHPPGIPRVIVTSAVPSPGSGPPSQSRIMA